MYDKLFFVLLCSLYASISKKKDYKMNKKIFISDGVGFVELLEVFGSDLTVANAARVSFNKESAMEPILNAEDGSVQGYQLAERDKTLIKFLAEHNHDSPFFHPILRFRIKMPIFIAREWWRSTVGFARNEVSRRYVTFEPQCFMPDYFRKRDTNVKQGSKDEAVPRNEQVERRIAQFYKEAIALYDELMQQEEVCPEQARMVLPQAMYTEFVETASLAGYARLVGLRTGASAQREIQAYARMVGELVAQQFPVSWQALRLDGVERRQEEAMKVKPATQAAI